MPRIIRMKFRPLYNFEALKHGDMIEVKSKSGAREMFRRWRLKTGSGARLVSATGSPNRLYFLDERLERDVA